MTNQEPNKTIRRLLQLAAIVVVVAFLVQGIVATAVSEDPSQARPVDGIAATRQVGPSAGVDFRLGVPDGNWISGRGVVEPQERPTKVSGAESGLIVEILVDEGHLVESGTLLARLDDAIQRAEREAARSEVESARIDRMRAETGSLLAEIRTARAELDEARADAELASRRAVRREALLRDDVISDEQLDEARLASAAAESRVQSLEARLTQLETAREEALLEAGAALDLAEARLKRAEAALERRLIRSPQLGEVLQVKYVAGEFYTEEGMETEPLLILGDMRKLRVRVDVDERDLAGLELGQTARVRAPAEPDRYFDAVITELGRRMGRKNVRTDDPIERTDSKILEVLVDLDPAEVDGRLLIGQRVDVLIDRG